MHRAKSEINYVRGVPPVVNDPVTTELLRDAMAARRGSYAIEDTEQSLGGEDFSWYLEHVPGAMARLGVRTPGDTPALDLHRGDFDVGRGGDHGWRGAVHRRGFARRQPFVTGQVTAGSRRSDNGFRTGLYLTSTRVTIAAKPAPEEALRSGLKEPSLAPGIQDRRRGCRLRGSRAHRHRVWRVVRREHQLRQGPDEDRHGLRRRRPWRPLVQRLRRSRPGQGQGRVQGSDARS